MRFWATTQLTGSSPSNSRYRGSTPAMPQASYRFRPSRIFPPSVMMSLSSPFWRMSEASSCSSSSPSGGKRRHRGWNLGRRDRLFLDARGFDILGSKSSSNRFNASSFSLANRLSTADPSWTPSAEPPAILTSLEQGQDGCAGQISEVMPLNQLKHGFRQIFAGETLTGAKSLRTHPRRVKLWLLDGDWKVQGCRDASE